MRRLLLVPLAVLLLCLTPHLAHAETSVFDLKVRGLVLGEVTLADRVTGGTYTVSGLIKSTGLAAMIRNFSYTGKAQGTLTRGIPAPLQYEEVADTGRRRSEAVLDYSGGAPVVVRYTSPKEAGPDSPDPMTQGGTVDPLTAIWALLRDVPRTRACALDLAIFDGKRRSSINLRPAGLKDGLPQCAGVYKRLQGFTAREVSRHTQFDFIVTYSAQGQMLRADSVAFGSFYGTAEIIRR
jgi:hypothetical protein